LSRPLSDGGKNPRFSIIIPVRNEAKHIGQALESIGAQECRDAYEVLVVDGGSDDGTREILARWAYLDPRIRVLDNPRRTTPAALNLAVQAACGEIVVRIDGHWRVPPDYLTRIDETFRRTEADSVGGRIMRLTRSRLAEGIEIARRTALGGHLSLRNDPFAPSGFVARPNIATCWKRDVMLDVGPFDESLLKNQDDEFNARLLRRGFSTYYDAAFHFDYYPPADLPRLFRQLFGYSLYGADATWKKGPMADARSRLMPLVSLVLSGVLLALLFSRPRWLISIVSGYIALIAMAAILVCVRKDVRHAPTVLLSYATIHFAVLFGWVLGTLKAIAARVKPARRRDAYG